jgi:DNA-directed RNA polymerase delta subunit
MIEMAKVTKTVVDKALRDKVFGFLFSTGNAEQDAQLADKFHKINDRQYGILLTDLNGEQRYIRIGAIVAELREDMTAEELMQSEIDTYQQKQADKAEKAKVKAEKIAKDKAKREAEAKAKEEGVSES